MGTNSSRDPQQYTMTLIDIETHVERSTLPRMTHRYISDRRLQESITGLIDVVKNRETLLKQNQLLQEQNNILHETLKEKQ